MSDDLPKHSFEPISEMISISRQLKNLFDPISAPESFVSQLREQLETEANHIQTVIWPRQAQMRQLTWATIILGGLAFSIGVLVVILRITRKSINHLHKGKGADEANKKDQ